jgi:hypothetical protein
MNKNKDNILINNQIIINENTVGIYKVAKNVEVFDEKTLTYKNEDVKKKIAMKELSIEKYFYEGQRENKETGELFNYYSWSNGFTLEELELIVSKLKSVVKKEEIVLNGKKKIVQMIEKNDVFDLGEIIINE